MGMTNTSYTGDVHSHTGRAHFYRSAEWKALREQVLERDHYECQWCKAEGRVTTGNDMTLEIDHIKTLEERPDLALDPDNLRTLCRDCHNKRHGRFNYRRYGRPHNPYAADEKW
jgi:5-methylcytosine-specific restriction endonuclease McrA